MRGIFRWFWRLSLVGVVVVAGLAAPALWVEFGCRPQGAATASESLLPPQHHRAEARTLLTYPEWHIVHAYDDYAAIIRDGDPHDFGFVQAVAGYWSSLCTLARASGQMGGIDGPTKQLVYTIGVSFTAEMMMKAAYEETLGRLATLVRGETRAPLDDLSADQAGDYAAFLTQTPWYLWDFRADAQELSEAVGPGLRDTERRVALGLENRAKAAYAKVIARAVGEVGPDAQTMRSVVKGARVADLAQIAGVRIIGAASGGIVIETLRYRAFTAIARTLAAGGAQFVEIAGNDQIMVTALSDAPSDPRALLSMPRQGRTDHRHLILLEVSALSDSIAGFRAGPLTLEHIHDY
jgi:hypothetical protein